MAQERPITHAPAPYTPPPVGGFDRSATADLDVGVGGAAAIAREQTELQAAIVVAKRFPRDEEAGLNRLLASCDRPAFAADCSYEFHRGGSSVTGPSAPLAREAARCWHNMTYDLRIVDQTDDRVHIRGTACDLEANTRSAHEDVFAPLIQRKGKGWIRADERDLRELIGRRGAILVRNSILQLLPPGVIDAAMLTARQALAREVADDPVAAAERCAAAFIRMGVNVKQLERWAGGRNVSEFTGEQIVDLRKIWKTIADGVATVDEVFPAPDASGPVGQVFGTGGEPASKTEGLAAKLTGELSSGVLELRARAARAAGRLSRTDLEAVSPGGFEKLNTDVPTMSEPDLADLVQALEAAVLSAASKAVGTNPGTTPGVGDDPRTDANPDGTGPDRRTISGSTRRALKRGD